jgi:hypothetical protein
LRTSGGGGAISPRWTAHQHLAVAGRGQVDTFPAETIGADVARRAPGRAVAWDAPEIRARRLHRVLGLTEVTAGGVGIIIGAGIYVLLGAATALAGPAVWLAVPFAAVLSLLTGSATPSSARCF